MAVIHINRHVIASNRKHGREDPPIAVRRTKSAPASYVSEYQGQGFRVVYRPRSPLSCGAVVWIETDD
jgi:hypothetical protein